MIVTCVYIHVKPDNVPAFIAATVDNHEESVKDQEIFVLTLFNRQMILLTSCYMKLMNRKKAASNHKTTVHYLKWRDIVCDFMAEPRNGIRYNIIEPKDRTKW